jgi:hypothetical protein
MKMDSGQNGKENTEKNTGASHGAGSAPMAAAAVAGAGGREAPVSMAEEVRRAAAECVDPAAQLLTRTMMLVRGRRVFTTSRRAAEALRQVAVLER